MKPAVIFMRRCMESHTQSMIATTPTPMTTTLRRTTVTSLATGLIFWSSCSTAESATAIDKCIRELSALADWLLACGVDTVALESTGVYWIPVFEVLEQRRLEVWLVDARLKYVPGRKSDVCSRSTR